MIGPVIGAMGDAGSMRYHDTTEQVGMLVRRARARAIAALVREARDHYLPEPEPEPEPA